jgi:hypothetical protein
MAKPADNTIVFPATVYKVQTLEDDGLRVAFDLPESAILQAAWLMECKRSGIALTVSIEAAPIPPT